MRHLLIASASLLSLFLTSQAYAQNTMDKAQVEKIVKEYLIANPEVVVDALNAYQAKQAKEASAKAQKAITDNKTALFNNKDVPNVGAKDADVVVVEFFDYHCGYCKHMLPTVTKLLKEDKKLRVAFHELPILSEDSRLASKAALAVYKTKPERYFEYHTALMSMNGKFDEARLLEEAKKLGVSEKQFKAALADPALEQQLDENRKLAESLGITGTPAFIVGNEFVPGAASYEALKELVDKTRKAKTAK